MDPVFARQKSERLAITRIAARDSSGGFNKSLCKPTPDAIHVGEKNQIAGVNGKAFGHELKSALILVEEPCWGEVLY
jgi:hypothetical protein